MQSTGKLIVKVFATQAQLPLEGATVVVTRRAANGKFDLVSIQKSDRSGLTMPVEVPTPNLSDSTAENGALQRPFAMCDVWAEHPGYLVLRVEGVQIFPGIVTRQDMELLPLGEGEHGLDTIDRRDISAQDL